MQIKNRVLKNPTVTLWSGAYKYGIRGYNDKVIEWRWYIPPELHGVLKLNLMELLDSAVSIYITIQQLGHGFNVLTFTDSSSAQEWTHKASLDPVNDGGHNTVTK